MNSTQPNFALSPRSNLQLNGRCGFNIQDDRVSINIDSIANQRDNTNLSGTLAIELWALKQPYQGENFDGVALAGTTIGQIQGQHFIPQCQYDLMFREPPAGNWHLALMLREWNGAAYETRDYVNFTVPYSASWVPTVVKKPSDNVISVSFNETEKTEQTGAKAAAQKPAKPAEKTAAKAELNQTAKTAAKKAEPKAAPKAQDSTLCLNTASQKEIAAIKGVSTKLAARLVEARPFKTLDDVLKVKGMGAKLLAKIEEVITL
ncbi:MAG: helix-hairpin-helix domain-containing protein [Pseudomonadota bacterium]|nr:helix-hairpin-helix domain-containing protein [Pseudomonadota bacterium]